MDCIETAVRSVQQGDISSYSIIVQHLQKPIFYYCYQLLGHIQEAEDAMQEVLVAAYEKFNSCKEPSAFKAWTYKIAYNHCMNIIRKRRFLQFSPITARIEKSSAYISSHTLSESVQAALETLTPIERSILYLRVFEEKQYEEISYIVGVKAPTARKRYERARKKLATKLTTMKGGESNEYYGFE